MQAFSRSEGFSSAYWNFPDPPLLDQYIPTYSYSFPLTIVLLILKCEGIKCPFTFSLIIKQYIYIHVQFQTVHFMFTLTYFLDLKVSAVVVYNERKFKVWQLLCFQANFLIHMKIPSSFWIFYFDSVNKRKMCQNTKLEIRSLIKCVNC